MFLALKRKVIQDIKGDGIGCRIGQGARLPGLGLKLGDFIGVSHEGLNRVALNPLQYYGNITLATMIRRVAQLDLWACRAAIISWALPTA
ncbi:hypothetical protein [Brevundimonas sp. GCM10030266]|uniref:hypothetical protein n=1 Tax=Brevundimonas sp. GCM10030266 TaxID=3273386 RepID=UPI003611BFC7